MQTYGFFFGMSLARLVLCHGDNLSVALQSSKMSASEGQQIAALTASTLEKLRTDAAFSLFWESTVRKSNDFDVAEPQSKICIARNTLKYRTRPSPPPTLGLINPGLLYTSSLKTFCCLVPKARRQLPSLML